MVEENFGEFVMDWGGDGKGNSTGPSQAAALQLICAFDKVKASET